METKPWRIPYPILGSAASPNMNFIDPIFFRIRTIVHCVTFITNWIGYEYVNGEYNTNVDS
jgi:hypothetical protein